MKKSYQKLYKLTSIISFLCSLVTFLLATLLLFGETYTTSLFASICKTLDESLILSDIESLQFSYIIFLCFASYDNFTAGKYYNFMSKAPDNQVVLALNSSTSILIFQSIFGLFTIPPFTIIAPIFAFISKKVAKKSFSKRITIEVPAIKLSQNSELVTIQPQAIQMMLLKIQELKNAKSRGLYTEEQYNQRLSEILSGHFE